MEDQREEIFDYLADKYDNHMKITGHVGAEEFFFSESTKRLSNITNILELACGTGITTRLLMNIFPAINVWIVNCISADSLPTFCQLPDPF